MIPLGTILNPSGTILIPQGTVSILLGTSLNLSGAISYLWYHFDYPRCRFDPLGYNVAPHAPPNTILIASGTIWLPSNTIVILSGTILIPWVPFWFPSGTVVIPSGCYPLGYHFE